MHWAGTVPQDKATRLSFHVLTDKPEAAAEEKEAGVIHGVCMLYPQIFQSPPQIKPASKNRGRGEGGPASLSQRLPGAATSRPGHGPDRAGARRLL
jgi:hypothetical protein